MKNIEIQNVLYEVENNLGNLVFMQASLDGLKKNTEALEIMISASYDNLKIAQKVLLGLKKGSSKGG